MRKVFFLFIFYNSKKKKTHFKRTKSVLWWLGLNISDCSSIRAIITNVFPFPPLTHRQFVFQFKIANVAPAFVPPLFILEGVIYSYDH